MSGTLLPELIERLASGDAEERRAAVVEISRRNDPDLLPHIAPLVSDPDASVRYYAKKAAASLAGAKRPDDAPARPAASAVPDRARARIDAIGRTVASGDRGELPTLRAQLAVEEDRYVRATLVKAVGALGAAEDAAALLPFLKDPDARVVANAVEALDMLGDPGARAAMLDLLAHPDTRVKGTLAQALWNYSGADTVGATLLLDRLRGMLDSEKPWDRESAVFVLGRIGTPEALALLERVRTDPEEQIRRMAEELLRKAAPSAPKPVEPERPKAAPKRAVHVAQEWRNLMDDRAEGAVARHLRALYDPERPMRENLAGVVLLLVAGLSLLFCLLVAVNVLSLLASPPGRPAVSAPPAAAAGDAALERLARAGDHERVLALLATRANPVPAERAAFERSAQALYAEGDRAADERSLADLLTAWEAVVPDSAALAVRRGDFALKFAADPVRAAESYRLALKREADRADAHLGLGDAALLSGRADEALLHYGKARERAPEGSRALFSCANALAHLKRFSEAEPLFRRAVEADPLSPVARLGLGKSLAALGRAGEAEREFAAAVAADPAFTPALLAHARLVRDTDPRRALELLKAAVDADPESVEPAREFARLLFALKMWKPAVAAYETLLPRAPGDARAAGEYGAALLGAGYPGAAKEALEKALALDAKCGVAHYHLALLEDAAGETKRSEEHLRAALEADYEPRAVLLTLASLALAAGRNEEALAHAERGLERFPGDLPMRYNKGAALVALSRREEATALFLDLAKNLKDADADLAARIRFFMAHLGAKAPEGQEGTEGTGK